MEVKFGNGQSGLIRAAEVKVNLPETGDSPVVEFVASDATLDRFGEIIEPNGWRLENYRKNPVFLNAHQSADVMCTIGKALETKVRDGKLVMRIEFAIQANPAAKVAYDLYKGGFLNAVSVGFIPIRWEDGKADSGFRRRYLEQELVELSAVGVPANPNALMRGNKERGVDALRELAEVMGRVR